MTLPFMFSLLGSVTFVPTLFEHAMDIMLLFGFDCVCLSV